MFHPASTDVVIAGHTIPSGATVIPLLGSFVAIPRCSNPDHFDPRRDNAFEHLTFGHGVHHCLGSPGPVGKRPSLEERSSGRRDSSGTATSAVTSVVFRGRRAFAPLPLATATGLGAGP
jgi:hypothetical protein